MNDDRPGGVPPASEPDTVQPTAEAAENRNGGWRMPEPKFQQTSGYLPQGYLGKVGLDDGKAAGDGAAPASTAEIPAPASVDVEPQPDLSEQIAEPPPIAPAQAASAKQRSTAARVVLVLLGVAGMIVFIAAFLAAVWYLFLRPADGGSPC